MNNNNITSIPKFFKNKNSSIFVHNLDGNNDLLYHNKDELLVPASITKLVSSSFYIQELGPDYQIPTEVYFSKSLNAGVLNGDLIIKGYGNPFFVTEDLYILVQELIFLGLQKVKGNLIIDTTYFDEPAIDINKANGLNNRAYSAKISATSLNFNSFTLRAKSKPGACTYQFDPVDSGYIKIRKATNNKNKPRGNFLKIENNKEIFDINGCEGTGYIAVENPPMYFAEILEHFLNMRDIEITGNIKLGKVTSGSKLVYTHQSKKLSQLIESMNTFSNNFMSESLLLHIAAKKKGVPGSFKKGMELLNAYAKSIKPNHYKFYNASGLTDSNKLSCNFTIDLLKRIYKDPPSFASIYLSMARPTKDGTLGYRSSLKGKLVSAKTGTLTTPVSSSGLAGFLQTKSGKNLAFCVIANKFKSLSGARSETDKFINKLISSI